MDWVLYHPEHGYYSTNALKIGTTGDFVTSPHLGADFGDCLAQQFVQMWEILDRPKPFTLLEMGAGQGLLAEHILTHLRQYHPDCFSALHYLIVEKSIALIQEQQQRLRDLIQQGVNIHWHTWDDIPSTSVIGCCFSNELVDAFPVHQVVWSEGRLQEVYVSLSTPGTEAERPEFCETLGELSTPRLADYFRELKIDFATGYPEHYRTEVNLAALDWLATVSDRLQQGYLLTIDYGYPAHRYYNPVRTTGTLQCYYQHAHHSDPYRYIGDQDLTAHVNITALEQWGIQQGLDLVGSIPQGLFLMALGLGDRIAELSYPEPSLSIQDCLKRRDALHSFINPMGLGNFTVLLQSKGLTPDQQKIRLKGLDTPT